ncbi:uncharacterized protein SCHCODRAFT_01124701 [Schizophyllum commune H4-8]|uniref:uncharacterized protein n=1 Tax=Schizophyllum commune (strain H4-8 / FGSC 9210) TaxID=578458 RepID=UPI00215FA0B1|nr:uncharacterized protein SCHCODRAFT_01124701 [Schizophyllum commune H4-8]KAI5897133.1 hypothetical protein SCHCODRAFT_01124701 [Schizophyllum commune H4-8]
MLVYNGKINWQQRADNECLTVVFPAGLALKDPVCAYWQWSDTAKTNVHQYGTINVVRKIGTEYKITFALTDFLFDAEFTPDYKNMTLKMYTATDTTTTSTSTLLRWTSLPNLVPSTKVYTGKLNWGDFATNEMMTLVVPNGISPRAPVSLYFQFTVDAGGIPKAHHCLSTTFCNVRSSAPGQIRASFDGNHYYKFDVIIFPGTANAKVVMNRTSTFDMQQHDWRQAHRKKALIVRYGTGSDNGISLLRDTLTTDLDFDVSDVEMLYYNSEPADGPAVVSDGQGAPTAARFKSTLATFLSGAEAGDVRFLYLDTLGAIRPGGEADVESGVTLAANEEGTEKEVVYNDWLATAIRDNLKGGVNLTILTSSCLGREMLGATTATGGILLSACHETQSNIKSLRIGDNQVDPWMYAIIAVIKKQIKNKRGVPTYYSLYNSAKKFIQSQLGRPPFDSAKYLGASADELSPTKRGHEGASNQDPQLIFTKGYVNPYEERFLFPFVAPRGGQPDGPGIARFPRDEYPIGVGGAL